MDGLLASHPETANASSAPAFAPEAPLLGHILALNGLPSLPDDLAAGAETNHAELSRERCVIRQGLPASAEPAAVFDLLRQIGGSDSR